jgi:hypothetical protein
MKTTNAAAASAALALALTQSADAKAVGGSVSAGFFGPLKHGQSKKGARSSEATARPLMRHSSAKDLIVRVRGGETGTLYTNEVLSRLGSGLLAMLLQGS